MFIPLPVGQGLDTEAVIYAREMKMNYEQHKPSCSFDFGLVA